MPERAPAIELSHEIGAGATGRVLHGVLKEPWEEWPAGTEVAVKELHARLRDDPVARRSLAIEAEVGRAVNDPGLVRVLGAGEGERGPYVVMQFVPGETLRATLASRGPLPEPLLRSVATQVAGGLASLHAAGYVHDDIKPENMRLDARGRAVLMDLGFARRLAPRRELARTRGVDGSHDDEPPLAHGAGVNPGSLAYLAPERARGQAGSRASDVFALGVSLYELATGVHPFDFQSGEKERASTAQIGVSSALPLRRSIDAPGADRLLASLATARFVPPSRLVPQLSPFLDHLLREMLLRDPEQRPASGELHQRLFEMEAGSWWRSQLDFGAQTPRGVMGAPEAAHLTPLVGRERELELLVAHYTESVHAAEPASRGGAMWLVGAAGSGKSRLMSDFAARVRTHAEPPLYLYGRCSALDDPRPCASVLRLLERYLRLPPGSAPGVRERELLQRIVPPTEADALVRALTPGLESAGDAVVPAALARWLAALARSSPLLVFLDDVNFADDSTFSVLGELAAQLRGARAFLVLGLREHEPIERAEPYERVRERLRTLAHASELRLEPLDEAAVLALVEQIFHNSTPQRRIAEVLWSRSRGNPGLLAEILRTLIERRQARPFASGGAEGDRKLVLTVSPERLPLPRSLQTLIQDRFRKLSLPDRTWLLRLAVVGGRIHPEFLVHAFPPAEARDIDAMLTRLVSAGWLVPAGDRYRFARPALREAVYRSMGAARRVRYHKEAARALVQTAAAPADADEAKPTDGAARMTLDDALQRAFHLRSAGEHAALLRIVPSMLAALARRGQPQRITTLARWGLEALDALKATRQRGRLRISLLEAAADAADRLGQRGEQRQWLDRLSDLELSPERDPEALARVYLLHGRYAVSTGQYGLARGMLRNAVELAERLSEPGEVLSETLRRLAAVQTHVGELDEARKLARRALDTAAHGPQAAVAWLQIGTIELLENELEDALRSVDRALALLRKSPDWNLPGAFAAGNMLRGRIYRLAGRPQRALGSMDRAVRLARQAGEKRLEMEATARFGGLLLDANRPQEAEARLREALYIANEIEDRRGQTLAGLWLGILLWEQNDPEAAPLVARVSRMASEMGLARAEALALAVQARVAREAKDMETALRLTERAMLLLERQGAELADRIVITGTRALTLHSAGQEKEAAAIAKDLRRRLRRENERLANPALRRSHRVASTRLLEAVLSPAGVIYPRVDLRPDSDGVGTQAPEV